MKRIVTVGFTLLLGSLLFVGCTPSASNADAKEEGYIHVQKHMTLQDMHDTIIKAGEESGWRMTEFKENSIIAEELDNSDANAVTITFSNDYFEITPENDDLKDAIENALQE